MKPKKPNLTKFLTFCFGPAIVGIALPSAHATTETWDGGAATNVLNTATNWTNDTLPTANGDTATWNGTVPGPLALTWNGGFGTGFAPAPGSMGTSILITTGQSSSLLIGSGSATTATNGDNFNIGDLTIDSGAGAFTFGDGIGFDNTVFRTLDATPINYLTNNSSNPATFASNVHFNSGGGANRTFYFDGTGDWVINSLLRFGNGPILTVNKNGEGILTLTGSTDTTPTPGTTAYLINGGTLKVAGSGVLGSATLTGNITNEAAFSYDSTASQTISGTVSGSGNISQSAGTLILTAANTYSGDTLITGGTFNVSGTGSIESTSGITVNGPGARYLHTSTTASLHNIALTQGTVGGTGTISEVTVTDNSGASIANGNGNSAPLTLENLTFNGDAIINVTDDGDTSTAGIVVTGPLSTTPANGMITVNASNSFWNSGVTYNLVSAGTFSASLSNFTLGTINGVTGRQAPSLVATGSGIGLLISGDNPKWSGLDNSNWVVGSTGANSNWKLTTLNTPTNYIQGDVVLFDNSATNKTVTISAANVSPAVVNFNNSTANNYTINGPFGIAAGALNKNGTGNVTISSTNTYTGGTTINAGTLTLSGAGTLGAASNALTAAGGTVNFGGTSQSVGSLAITGEATLQNGTLTASGLTASNPGGSALISSSLDLGSGTLSKSGDGTLTLSGATTYSGTTTISGGILALSGSGTLGSSSGVTLSGGTLDLGGTSQSTNAITISAVTTSGDDTIRNGSIEPTAFNITTTAGVAMVSANIGGVTGITRSGGGGTLTLTGANTFSGPLNFAGNGTVTIDGGSNTGGGAITYNSFGSTLTINDGSYVTSGISSSGYSEFRFLNLNGGVLESFGNIFTGTLAISTVFNGGTLKSGNPDGITLFDANNQIVINVGGANFDTTTGNVTVGLNTGGAAALANPLTRLNGTAAGTITLLGGNSLLSGIANNGLLDIQDNSTWNLNGVASSVSGLIGNGSVTSSPGSAVLTINTASSNTYAGTIAGAGKLSLLKQGAGDQTLTTSNTIQGDITVAAGTLVVSSNSSTTFANTTQVSLVTGAVLNLPNAATDIVAGVVVDGTSLLPGTYDAASPQTTGLITGNGKLQVVAGFANWISQFTSLNAAQRLANADPDADGIPNLVEYAIAGQDPTVSNPSAGSFTGNTLSFTKRSGTIGLTYSIMASTDLGLTDDWTVVTGGPYVNNATTISYTLTPGTPVKNFVRLDVAQN